MGEAAGKIDWARMGKGARFLMLPPSRNETLARPKVEKFYPSSLFLFKMEKFRPVKPRKRIFVPGLEQV